MVPCRRSVGGDDAFAALEGFGDDKTEVLGEGRENEDVAPVPDFLELVAKGGRDVFNAETQSRRVRRGILYLPDGSFKILDALQRVSAAEVEEMKRFSLFIIFNAEAQRRRVRREEYKT